MSTTWVLDLSHSELFFKVKHLMITNVKGNFQQFDATIDGEVFASAPVNVKVEVNSINTNNNDRDAHLKSADFFDAEQFPEMNFVSTSFQQNGGSDYKLNGNLTIKGVTKPITLDVTYGGTNKDPWGNEKIGFELKGKFNRSDFGLTWNAALETGGVMVSDEVKVEGEVQFVKK